MDEGPDVQSPAEPSGDRTRHLEATLRLIAELSSCSIAGSNGSSSATGGYRTSAPTHANTPDAFSVDISEPIPGNISLSSLLAATRSLLAPDPKRDCQLSRPGSRASSTSVHLPQPAYVRGLFDVCSRQLPLFLPAVDYDEIANRALKPVSSTTGICDTVSMLVESRDVVLFSQLYLTLALGRCLSGLDHVGKDASEGWSFYHRGSSLINEVQATPTHWIDLAKLHLLRATYLTQADDLQAALQAIWLSVLFALQAKLNDQSTWTSLSPRATASRKRLWWAIYCMDRRLAQKCGRPSHIREEEIMVDDLLTRDQLVACQDLEVLPDGISHEELHLQLLVDISRLWGKIWDTFFRAGHQTSHEDEEVDMMDLRISHLHRTVPASFRWTDSLLDGVTSDSKLDLRTSRRLVVHIRLTLLRLLIRQNPKRTAHVSLEKAKFCSKYACEAVDLLAAFTVAFSPDRISPLGYFIASSLIECSYHIAGVLQNPDCREELPIARQTFRKLLETMELLAPTCKTAQRALPLLCPYAPETTLDQVSVADNAGDSGGETPTPAGVELGSGLAQADWSDLPCLPPDLGVDSASHDYLALDTILGDPTLGAPIPEDFAMDLEDWPLPEDFLTDARLGYLG
ncbi:hypothetical protein NCS56_00342700 [Fusarium sp. Ph1]|nr:hypothetical protein NCS56_00342700 [Fusarium sp. Ph1]